MRMKAKTSPTGYVATLADRLGNQIEFPIARFDEAGQALMCSPEGRLVPALAQPGFLDVSPIGQASRA